MSSILIALTLAAGATWGGDIPNPNPWELVRDDENLKIWARDVPDSEVREVRAETTVDASIVEIWKTLDEIEHHQEFMPYVVESRVIERSPQSVFMYQRIDPPFVDDRDYGLKISLFRDEAAGVFRRKFTQANYRAPKLPEDTVRVTVVEGTWELTRIDPSKTRIRYWLYTDPGGSIPKWIVNFASKSSVASLIDAVRKRSMDRFWKRS